MKDSKPLDKSYRSTNLHKYKKINTNIEKTNIYLLVQIIWTDKIKVIKYLSVNTNNNNLIPTTKPSIYLQNYSNIVNKLKFDLNDNLILNVYILNSFDVLDIVNYKINTVILDNNILYRNLINEFTKLRPLYYLVNKTNETKQIILENEIDKLTDIMDNLKI
jgi:hypothetical protein